MFGPHIVEEKNHGPEKNINLKRIASTEVGIVLHIEIKIYYSIHVVYNFKIYTNKYIYYTFSILATLQLPQPKKIRTKNDDFRRLHPDALEVMPTIKIIVPNLG